MAKQRLDAALTARGLAASREQAKRAVMAGRVRVNGAVCSKPGRPVGPDDALVVTEPERYVSRGGYKLEAALEAFGLDPQGRLAIDVGASTGGFTDCLLQRGAARVFAVDVGRGQLAWKLRQDPRVTVMERTNARRLAPEMFPQPFCPFDLAVIDCSFISLRLILPPVARLLQPGGDIVALIKPQFEAGKKAADRGRGVIRDPETRRRAVEAVEVFARSQGLIWLGAIPSPILGPAGNQEFLARLQTPPEQGKTP